MKIKRIVLGTGIGLALLVASLGYAMLWRDQNLASQDELSPRAQLFLDTQRQTGKSMWNDVSFDTPSPAVLGLQSFSLSCFSVSLPWPVVEERREENSATCSFVGKVSGQSLRIAIHSQPFSGPLSEYPGVNLRLRDPKKYHQVQTNLFTDEESTVIFELVSGHLHSLAFSGGMERDRSATIVERTMRAIEFK